MNFKTGAYSIPAEIQALAPKDISCQIEAQYYQPKKNGQPSGPLRTYYYVYEDRSTDNRPTGKTKHSRQLLGNVNFVRIST